MMADEETQQPVMAGTTAWEIQYPDGTCQMQYFPPAMQQMARSVDAAVEKMAQVPPITDVKIVPIVPSGQASAIYDFEGYRAKKTVTLNLPRGMKITVGTVDFLPEDSDPTVTTELNADGDMVINFGIPKGHKGDPGSLENLRVTTPITGDGSSVPLSVKTATTERLGVIKIGDGLEVDSEGTVSAGAAGVSLTAGNDLSGVVRKYSDTRFDVDISGTVPEPSEEVKYLPLGGGSWVDSGGCFRTNLYELTNTYHTLLPHFLRQRNTPIVDVSVGIRCLVFSDENGILRGFIQPSNTTSSLITFDTVHSYPPRTVMISTGYTANLPSFQPFLAVASDGVLRAYSPATSGSITNSSQIAITHIGEGFTPGASGYVFRKTDGLYSTYNNQLVKIHVDERVTLDSDNALLVLNRIAFSSFSQEGIGVFTDDAGMLCVAAPTVSGDYSIAITPVLSSAVPADATTYTGFTPNQTIAYSRYGDLTDVFLMVLDKQLKKMRLEYTSSTIIGKTSQLFYLSSGSTISGVPASILETLKGVGFSILYQNGRFSSSQSSWQFIPQFFKNPVFAGEDSHGSATVSGHYNSSVATFNPTAYDPFSGRDYTATDPLMGNLNGILHGVMTRNGTNYLADYMVKNGVIYLDRLPSGYLRLTGEIVADASVNDVEV